MIKETKQMIDATFDVLEQQRLEIEHLRAAILSVQRSAFDAGYDAGRDGKVRLIEYSRWSGR